MTCQLFAFLLASPAHSITLPVEGSIQNSDETFSGKAYARLTGGGTITLETNRNVTCQGSFVHTGIHEGNGTVTCDDGRLGVFDFVTRGLSGSGVGTIGLESFVFRIGK